MRANSISRAPSFPAPLMTETVPLIIRNMVSPASPSFMTNSSFLQSSSSVTDATAASSLTERPSNMLMFFTRRILSGIEISVSIPSSILSESPCRAPITHEAICRTYKFSDSARSFTIPLSRMSSFWLAAKNRVNITLTQSRLFRSSEQMARWSPPKSRSLNFFLPTANASWLFWLSRSGSMMLEREVSIVSSRASRLLDLARLSDEKMPRQMIRICPERSSVARTRRMVSSSTCILLERWLIMRSLAWLSGKPLRLSISDR